MKKADQWKIPSSCCCPNPNYKRRHLIFSYFVESSGIVEIFRALFSSYFTTDDVIKLNHREDFPLIERLKEVVAFVYPRLSQALRQTWKSYATMLTGAFLDILLKGRKTNLSKYPVTIVNTTSYLRVSCMRYFKGY